MARLPRLFIPGCPQHVIQRGNNRQAIFVEQADYEQFLAWLRYAAIEQKLNVHAYVLMPNHFHLLTSAAEAGVVARVLQSVGRRYVQYFNKKYTRTGTLWEGRYRSTSIESEHYLFRCARYIELNPVRASLIQDPAHYPWSSYRANIGLTKDPLITQHPLYWALGNTPFEREAAYKALVAEGMSEQELQKIRETTQKGWALGSETFVKKQALAVGRALTTSPRGRPKKTLKTVPN